MLSIREKKKRGKKKEKGEGLVYYHLLNWMSL